MSLFSLIIFFTPPPPQTSLNPLLPLSLLLRPSTIWTLPKHASPYPKTSLPHFNLSTFAHNSCCSNKSPHLHFPTKVLLKITKSLILNPPNFFDWKSLSHLTHAIFHSSPFVSHKNLLCILINSFSIVFNFL